MSTAPKYLTLAECQERLERVKQSGHSRINSPEWQARAAEMCKRQEAWDREQLDGAKRYRRRVTHIPALYHDKLDAPEERAALIAAREFMASDKLLLVLGGAGGEGKTFAAAWCVDQGGPGGEFIKAGEIGAHGQFDALFWQDLTRRPTLAIDELGQDRIDRGGWFAGAFCDLLDARVLRKHRTILTTNLAGKDFMERYASGDFARLKRRWTDHGRFVPVSKQLPLGVAR